LYFNCIHVYVMHVQYKSFNLVTDSLANPIVRFFGPAKDNPAPPDALVFPPGGEWVNYTGRTDAGLPPPIQPLGLGSYR